MSAPAWTEKLSAIRERHAAASRGPWYWFGYLTSRGVGLHGPRMSSVMEFRRWGMQGAQPVFCTDGILQDVSETAAPDTSPGRGRITDINHPDARFIAASWQDVQDLLARVDELETGLRALHDVACDIPTAHDDVRLDKAVAAARVVLAAKGGES